LSENSPAWESTKTDMRHVSGRLVYKRTRYFFLPEVTTCGPGTKINGRQYHDELLLKRLLPAIR